MPKLSHWEKVRSHFFYNKYNSLGWLALKPIYLGEEKGARGKKIVKYFTEEEKQQYKVNLTNGLFYDSKGGLVNTINPKEVGRYAYSSLYVIDRDYQFYIVGCKVGHKLDRAINHSSVLAGKPILCAGYVTVTEGKLISLSNESGHYTPPEEALLKLMHHLARQGVPREQYEVRYQGRDTLRPIVYTSSLDFIQNHPFKKIREETKNETIQHICAKIF